MTPQQHIILRRKKEKVVLSPTKPIIKEKLLVNIEEKSNIIHELYRDYRGVIDIHVSNIYSCNNQSDDEDYGSKKHKKERNNIKLRALINFYHDILTDDAFYHYINNYKSLKNVLIDSIKIAQNTNIICDTKINDEYQQYLNKMIDKFTNK